MQEQVPWEYLTTDLDLWAEFDISPLAGELAESGMLCAPHPVSDFGDGHSPRFKATFNAAGAEDDGCWSSLTKDLDDLLSRIELLRPDGRRMWDRLSSRQFNVGVAAGTTRCGPPLSLGPAVLARMAAVGGELVFTPYPTVDHSAFQAGG